MFKTVFVSFKRCFSGVQPTKVNHLIRLLKESCVNFLQVVTVSTGMTKNNLNRTSMHSLSSLFCVELKKGNRDWCDLTLMRSIAQTQQIRRAFSTKPWIDVLLSFLLPSEGDSSRDVNLPKQVGLFQKKKVGAGFNCFFFAIVDIDCAVIANCFNIVGFG